ncbi:hypothetical protein SDJN03_09876, partial [Cucurbita argyrosperma subsp. sororia]
MLLHFSYQIFEGLDIKGFLYFLKIWSLLLFGQIPSGIKFVLSRKCLTGVSLFLEIFFCTGGVMKLLFEIGVGSLVQPFKALLMQYPDDFLGENSAGS